MTPADVDLSTLFDALYDASLDTFGMPLSTGIFDRTRLIPLSQLPQMVRRETEEVLPPERLDALVELGWTPDLRLPDSGQHGFAIYEPSRVGLFLELERKTVSVDPPYMSWLRIVGQALGLVKPE